MGYECWLDPQAKIGHQTVDKMVITPDNRPPQEWIEQMPEYQAYWQTIYASSKYDPMEEGEDFVPRLVSVRDA